MVTSRAETPCAPAEHAGYTGGIGRARYPVWSGGRKKSAEFERLSGLARGPGFRIGPSLHCGDGVDATFFHLSSMRVHDSRRLAVGATPASPGARTGRRR